MSTARDAFIRTMPEALIVLDANGCVVDLNPAAEKLLASEAKDILGEPAATVFAAWPDLFKDWPNVDEAHTHIIQSQGESPRYEELSFTNLKDNDGRPNGCLVILREVTQRVPAAEDCTGIAQDLEHTRQLLRERTKQLEEANRELEAFVHTVSHDLRAPLRGIDGYSKALLEDNGPQLDELGKAYLGYIREASRHMAELIEGLLKLSRIMYSEIHLTRVDLSAIATEIAVKLKGMQPERLVTFRIAPQMVVLGDHNLLNILLRNLLDNAWKFTSKHASALIEVGSEEQSGTTLYYVRDDGVGFNNAYSDKLFKPFQRLHSNHEFEGSGIGLAIVGRIIKRHNGRVWAEGAIEKGATIYFTLQGDSL